VTPSDLRRAETTRLLPATSTAVMLAVARGWCPVPRMTSSEVMTKIAQFLDLLEKSR